jgi:hypothetical protein
MEVIERKNWKLDHDCTGSGNGGKGCGSRLRVSRDDLRYWPGVDSDSWGQSDPAVGFKCPVCGSVTDLDKSQWPVRHQALTPFTTQWRDAPATDLEN